jgi:anthranilate synthase/indole-3-glycerol phosphate synthase/phosphoribosylanthranilate isomerase
MDNVPKETIVCALSGISGPDDVTSYQNNGVGAVLVGEALMRAHDPSAFANKLLGRSEGPKHSHDRHNFLVKICGTRTPQAAKAAIEAGADMIGIILVEGRKRCVSKVRALEISEAVRQTPRPTKSHFELDFEGLTVAKGYFEHTTAFFQRTDRAMLVGVFQNQPLSYILAQQKLLNLDVVQLHGSEPVEWASLIPVPVIRRFGPTDPGLGRRGYHALPLLDSASGGTGQRLDIDAVKWALGADSGLRVVLAGGLNPENVETILSSLNEHSPQLVAVDVSSGVEENGVQDLGRIKDFVGAVRRAERK